VKYLIGRTALIQSVDRVPLLDELEKRSVAGKVTTEILLEVNGGGEKSKSGVLADGAEELLGYAETCAHIRVRGMMCVLPKNAPHALYEKACALYEKMQKSCATFDTLSMGMSDDFETAIMCGATMIRPGQALFGAR
ncbi:MAG: alanine racemase, partial [Clostridiales bacterium]|nr:alanine racemase [Clostridiales bacterium]